MIRKFAGAILLLQIAASCSYFSNKGIPEGIARVGESYLEVEEIDGLVPARTPKEDSTAIIRNYIDRWAAQKLLSDAAEINLSDDQKAEYDDLVRQYKIDLYTKAYIEQIVKATVDTVVTDDELAEYYKINKDNFRTTESLVKLRYIQLLKDNPKYGLIKSKFFDFRKSDRKFWDAYSLQFKSYSFNDSVWVSMNQIYKILPFINPDNRDKYIASGKSSQVEDGTNMYLVKVVSHIDQNQTSPFEYIKPTLIEVILNRRKLELIKKFEKEIIDDAIKDKKYEIYK